MDNPKLRGACMKAVQLTFLNFCDYKIGRMHQLDATKHNGVLTVFPISGCFPENFMVPPLS